MLLTDLDGTVLLPSEAELAAGANASDPSTAWLGCIVAEGALMDGTVVAVASNVATAEECCRACRANATCNVWNYCARAGGCRCGAAPCAWEEGIRGAAARWHVFLPVAQHCSIQGASLAPTSPPTATLPTLPPGASQSVWTRVSVSAGRAHCLGPPRLVWPLRFQSCSLPTPCILEVLVCCADMRAACLFSQASCGTRTWLTRLLAGAPPCLADGPQALNCVTVRLDSQWRVSRCV